MTVHVQAHLSDVVHYSDDREPNVGVRSGKSEPAPERIPPASTSLIVGSTTFVNGIVFYFKDQPSTFDIDNPKQTPWVGDDRIRREGAVLVCPETEAFCMRALGGFAAHFPVVADEDAVVSRRFFGFASPPERYEIIVIPPDPS